MVVVVRAGHDCVERFLAQVCALHQVRHRVHITDSEVGNAAPYVLEDVELAALAYPNLDQRPRLTVFAHEVRRRVDREG